MKKLLIFATGVFLSFSGIASAEELPDWDRFKLWNECEPIFPSVWSNSVDASSIGLSQEVVGTAVRSRLRGARIFSDDNFFNSPPVVNGVLSVNVDIVGGDFYINVELLKFVRDHASGMSQRVVTWKSEVTGTHNKNGDSVLSAVSRQMDKFIDEYLRVNAEAC